MRPTIGKNIYLTLRCGKNHVRVLAKVDTGAFSSSISEEVSAVLKLEGRKVDMIKQIKSASGRENREFYEVKMSIPNVMEIDTEVNVADREGLKYQMILGRKDIAKFKALVDVTKAEHKKVSEIRNYKQFEVYLEQMIFLESVRLQTTYQYNTRDLKQKDWEFVYDDLPYELKDKYRKNNQGDVLNWFKENDRLFKF